MDVTPKQGTQITKLKKSRERGKMTSGEWIFRIWMEIIRTLSLLSVSTWIRTYKGTQWMCFFNHKSWVISLHVSWEPFYTPDAHCILVGTNIYNLVGEHALYSFVSCLVGSTPIVVLIYCTSHYPFQTFKQNEEKG